MDSMFLLVVLILVVVAALFPIVLTLRLMSLACRALEIYISLNKDKKSTD